MKILISVQYFSPPVGGAEYSLLNLAKKMSEKHEIYVLQPGKNDEVKRLDQIKIIVQKVPIYYKLIWYDQLSSPWWVYHISPVIFQARYWRKVVEKKINEIKPNLIVTQLNFGPPSIDIAVKHNIPSILFIRSYESLCFVGFINGTDCTKQCKNCIALQNKIHFLAAEKWLEWNRKAITNADLVIANSKFVANITKEWYGTEPIVLYPSIDATKYQSKQHSKKYITLINPTKSKGVDIFLKIIESVHDKKFLVVGHREKKSDEKITSISNVKFVEWTNKVEDVYNETKILLMPVEWPEPFGRAVIEAGLNGIPTIASNRGGLPEAVGAGGILINDIYNIDKWVEAIQSLDDETLYNRLSENAKKHAQKFDFKNTFKDFKEVVKENLGIEL